MTMALAAFYHLRLFDAREAGAILLAVRPMGR
jgi:hypothetical protein